MPNMDVVMHAVVDMVKAIEENITSIHQIMKEQGKNHIPKNGVENGIIKTK